MNDFKETIIKMLEERNYCQEMLIEAKGKLQNCEAEIVNGLIRDEQFDLFSVNWRRMHTIAYGTSKVKRIIREN